mgnify:CR=1 FL=1
MKTLKTLLTTLAAGIMTLSPVITLVQAVEKNAYGLCERR